MKKRIIAVLAAAAAVAAVIPVGEAGAYPSNILHAHTSTAASHAFTVGDSNDRLQTHIKCSTLGGGIAYVNGPWVGRGVWSQAYCPRGYYRASEAVLLQG